MHYGTIINGGAPMRKGVTKEINDKLEGLAENRARGEKIAKAVEDAYKVKTLSSQHTDNVKQRGQFEKPKQVKNV
jgi:hypothetical protein